MINRRILTHLNKARKDLDEKELKYAYQCISTEISSFLILYLLLVSFIIIYIQADLEKFGTNSVIYPDLLVLCAEVAAEV